jgi:hypothetical protein
MQTTTQADICIMTCISAVQHHSTSLIGETLGDYGAVFAELNAESALYPGSRRYVDIACTYSSSVLCIQLQ